MDNLSRVGSSHELVGRRSGQDLNCMCTIYYRCAIPMVEKSRKDVSDGVSWWCRQCKAQKTIRTGRFFEKSKLPLQKWLLIIHFWARQLPVTDAQRQL